MDGYPGSEKKGFTLLEILVAAIILALVMTGIANIFLASKKYVIHGRSRIQGAELGRAFLAPLQMGVRQDQWGNNCVSANVGCPSVQTIDSIKYTPTYEVSQVPGTEMRKVKVQIKWNEPTSN